MHNKGWGEREVVKGEWESICRENDIKPSIFQSELSNIHLFTSLISLRLPFLLHPFTISLSPSYSFLPVISPTPPLNTAPSAASPHCVNHPIRPDVEPIMTQARGQAQTNWDEACRRERMDDGEGKWPYNRRYSGVQRENEIHENLCFSRLISLLIRFLMTW